MAKYIEQSVAIARLTRLEVTTPNATMTEAKRVLADMLPTDVVLVQGKLICDPLSADKPEAIGPEVRRKAREILMEELEAKGLIRYQMFHGVLYAGIRVAAPEKKT